VTKFLALIKVGQQLNKKMSKYKIGSNPSHIITRIQSPIQLVVAHTIHCARGLTLDYLAFDPINLTKHG
jgi:hypothetical protein